MFNLTLFCNICFAFNSTVHGTTTGLFPEAHTGATHYSYCCTKASSGCWMLLSTLTVKASAAISPSNLKPPLTASLWGGSMCFLEVYFLLDTNSLLTDSSSVAAGNLFWIYATPYNSGVSNQDSDRHSETLQIQCLGSAHGLVEIRPWRIENNFNVSKFLTAQIKTEWGKIYFLYIMSIWKESTFQN